MAKYARTYYDSTHGYRIDGTDIVMIGADGLDHRMVRCSRDDAMQYIKMLINVGGLRKTKPLSALPRVEGQKKNTTDSIPQNRRKAND